MQSIIRPGQRLGLMGGTFNPVHLGHLRAAEEIAESLNLDQVYFIPAASPPHKAPGPVVDYWRRLEMMKFAVSDRPGFWMSELESRLSFPSYTINTVQAFKQGWGEDAAFFFLVGLDSFLTIAEWHRYQELLNEISFVVFGRAGLSAGLQELEAKLKTLSPDFTWSPEKQAFISSTCRPVYYRPGCKLEISSTDLRQRLESGASVRYLVPEAVRLYIEARGLYRASGLVCPPGNL